MGYGKIKVAVVHAMHGVLRSHFHLQLGAVARHPCRDAAPDIDRAGKADRIHARLTDKMVAHILAL